MITLDDIVSEFLTENDVTEELLPLFHTTDYGTFTTKIIIDDHIKSTKPCKYHDNENLVFFFYGKAAYYPNKNQKDSFLNNPPITLIYNFQKLEKYNFKRLVCFDSGGYILNKYIFEDGGNPDIKTFTITNPDQNKLLGVLQTLFQNNTNYFENKYELYFNLTDNPLSPCLLGLDKLKKMKDSGTYISEFGEQAFTIELQLRDAIIELNPEAIIIPSKLYKTDKAIEQWKKYFPNTESFLTYPDNKNTAPSLYENMRECALEYSKQRSIL